MDDLLREFVGETLDMMDAIAGDLVAWEADPSDRSGLDGIFRTVHTVKGSSGFFDIPRISAVAHAAEELLDVLRARRGPPSRASVAMILAAFDQIRELTQAIASTGKEPAGDDSRLIKALIADIRSDNRTPEAHLDVAEIGMGEPTSVGVDAEPHELTGDVPAAWRSVRVPVDLLDQLMSGVSDLVLARNEVAAQMRARGLDLVEVAAFERLSQLLVSVRSTVSNMRMVSLRHLYAPLPRLVRQVADELGKDVHLALEGSEVEIDREVVEALRDPMLHILRNAIDHGLESREQRQACGKPTTGQIVVHARQAGNRILISVADDGAGLSLDSLVNRAIKAGHITVDRAAELSDQRKADLVFMPGLSTADQVTGISGRGVGMDVVKANVERLGGSIRIDNRAGQGVTLTLDVPMTLTIIAALAIEAGGQSFAIPRSAVSEVMLASSDVVQRHNAGSANLVRIRDRILPLVRLETALSLTQGGSADPEDRALIICRLGQGGAFALDVADVRDHEELVIKPLPPALLSIGFYSGLSLPDNGQPMLVLDVEGIARQHITQLPSDLQSVETADVAGTIRKAAEWLSFEELATGRRRAVAMSTVQRILNVQASALTKSGGRLLATVEDEILPVALEDDCAIAGSSVRMIRLSDGCRTALLPVAEIGDMLDVQPQILPAGGKSGLLGMTLVDGTLVELVDCYDLLGRFGSVAGQALSLEVSSPEQTRVTERLLWIVDPAGGEWAASFLVPTLTAAGYRIGLVDRREAISGPAGTIITLADEGPAGPLKLEKDGAEHSLSAYDRKALMTLIGGETPPAKQRSIKKGREAAA